MELNSTEIEKRGHSFQIRELSVGQIMPFVSRLGGEDQNAQMELVASAVLMDGKPVTAKDVTDWPMSVFSAVIAEVLDVNGMSGGDEEEEGND